MQGLTVQHELFEGVMWPDPLWAKGEDFLSEWACAGKFQIWNLGLNYQIQKPKCQIPIWQGFSIKKQTIIVFLKYYRSGNALNSIFCLSKPSKRFYLSKKEIVSLSKKKDFFVILTSKGFFSNRNIFDSSFSGGEVFCVIT